jgi:hypothetical protein
MSYKEAADLAEYLGMGLQSKDMLSDPIDINGQQTKVVAILGLPDPYT